MSRGPRDLRDLICVSRLTFRQSDDEAISDDDRVRADLDNLSLDSSGSADSRQGSAGFGRKHNQNSFSPDSGVATNDCSPSDPATGRTGGPGDEDLKLDLSVLQNKKKAKRKKKKKGLPTEPPKFPFPKPPPLPPVSSVNLSESQTSNGLRLSRTSLSSFSETETATGPTSFKGKRLAKSNPKSKTNDKVFTTEVEESNDVDEESVPVKARYIKSTTYRVPMSNSETGDFDEMMCFMDATIVSTWLARASTSISDVSTYLHAGDNFVHFAHFWLTDFPDVQKHEIFEMEIEILREELGFAFGIGKEQGRITAHDISNLIGAIFREYPVRLHSSKGNFMFLDYMDILASEKTPRFKKLLSDVKCSTKNKQYAQWLLATRSLALIGMWCAIVNFYRNLLGKHGPTSGLPLPESLTSYRNVYEKRLFQSLRLGFTDVIHYMGYSEQVNVRLVDSHERTLIFNAVMHNQPKVLQYLVTRVKPAININQVSDTGNTALHAAVNNGSAALVATLLRSPNINVNCVNTQCDGATPLHLAVMHGQTDVAELLVRAGADKTLKMGDLTAEDIAREFDHPDILEVIKS